ncbi:cupin domain-containing protein [Roseomonas sp. HJA6]|uniref:Cupin domain-containing protein n=1 Tax=Roseomonas alba TaxID=2846776 RepID=A0ABS7AF34_9PROT|nr:cupin domain-containing protein [Neoroseomonas alba]MBW6400915.1 cupin domain-containing protein [Neoroseomonas alba]
MEAQTAPRTVRIGALELHFHVDETDGAGDVVMFDFVVPPNARVPAPHYHEACDEIVYGLDGIMTTTRAGVVHEVRKGDVVFIPRGIVHHHTNLHDEIARALIVIAPGTIGRRYFEEMAEAISQPGPPDMARLKEIMLRHGLVPA